MGCGTLSLSSWFHVLRQPSGLTFKESEQSRRFFLDISHCSKHHEKKNLACARKWALSHPS